MGTYTKNLKLETPSYTDSADIPALTKKNNDIIDSEMIKRANGLDYNEQTGVLQLTGNNSKVGSPIQIKNNLPVTSMASGTELKVNNYKQLIKFSKEGKTEQKTYTGKNIFNYITTLVSSNYGLTSKINTDGSITTTGKITRDYASIVSGYLITDELEDGETYTLSQAIANDKVYAQINARKKSDNTYTYIVLGGGTNKSKSFKVDKTTYASYTIDVQTNTMAQWGDESLTITNKYMLCKGTDTVDTSFEPYVGATSSPNPAYPQEIENIKGIENIWFGGESTTNNGITFTKNADGSYDITGTATAQADCINLVNIANAKLKNGINYNLSINKLTNEKVSILTEVYIENWDSHVIGPLITSTTLSTNKIINIKDNITRVRYVIRVEKGQTVNIKGLKIQLEEGSIAHNFVPNGSNYLQLENVGENILNIDETPFTVKKITSQGNVLYWSGYSGVNDFVKVKEKTTYKFSSNEVNKVCYIDYYDKNKNYLSRTGTAVDYFTTPEKCKYIKFAINLELIPTNAQLMEGTIIKPYEQYQEKIINVDLKGNELCSNLDKTTNDELIVENSKAKINKIIKEFTFTGDEEFTKRSDGDGSTTITFNLPIHEDIVELNTVSNMFSYEQSSTSGNEGIGVSIGNNKLVYIQIKRSRLSSLDVAGFKEFLKTKYNAGTPLKIQCELIEPEVIDLGKVDFDLIENSTLTCEEESDMQIDYLTIDSNIFVQDSLDGSSSQKAPSIDAVNKAINKISNYSSEEQCIGEWFGEKHYRKVFEIDMDSTLKQMTIPTGIDMKQLTHAYGVALNSDTIYLPLNFYNNLGWDSFHLTGKGANIILQRGDNFSITKVFITLEYTKNV